MVVQTAYSIEHEAKYKGMLADQQLWNSVSRLNKGASPIPFGQGVVTDGEDGAKLPTAASVVAEFNGVAMRELNRATPDGDAFGAVAGRDYTVLTHGVIWVEVLDTVVKDAPVYLRVGATGLGDFSGVVGAGVTLGILLDDTKFITGGDAGDLVKISLGIGG